MQTFDLVVIGSGPAGQRASIQAAKLRKSVALIERAVCVGGVCINTGTIPSKTLREAVLDLSGARQRALYGSSARTKAHITAQDLLARTSLVMSRERDVIRSQLQRNGVELLEGHARFESDHEVAVDNGDAVRWIRGERIVIAVGTTPGIPRGVAVDHRRVITSDDILDMTELPRQMIVVGAGIIGVEYATMFATLGVRVTIVDKRTEILDMVDREVVDAMTHQMRNFGVTLRLGEEVASITSSEKQLVVALESGKRSAADLVMVSAGRLGATDDLALASAGVTADDRGRIPVNESYQTSVPHIYAVGDVIGHPSLASTSMEQGRLATCHAFGMEATCMPSLYPFGIYAVPEVAWVGRNERELTSESVPFETGVARYREIARGQILGDVDGMLKIIFHLETREILGVWALGTQATELIHIGQAVMAHGGTIDYFVNTVFNYPTLAECYKVAALDGFNRVSRLPSATLRLVEAEPPGELAA